MWYFSVVFFFFFFFFFGGGGRRGEIYEKRALGWLSLFNFELEWI